MAGKIKNKNVLAICIQETTEDGSELNIGDEFSTEDTRYIHHAFIADTLVNVMHISDMDVHLFYSDIPETGNSVDTILNYLKKKLKGGKAKSFFKKIEVTALPAECWGSKMESIFQKCFDFGYEHVLFIGSRTPTLKENLLKMALKLLKKSDAVFGPSIQGRYYLIGMSGKYHVNLSEFDWRSPNIYSEVAEKFRQKGLSWSELEIWYAVEHPEDLEFLVRDINQYRLEGDEISAKETEMVLKRVMERQD